jgi:hypothetical protein
VLSRRKYEWQWLPRPNRPSEREPFPASCIPRIVPLGSRTANDRSDPLAPTRIGSTSCPRSPPARPWGFEPRALPHFGRIVPRTYRKHAAQNTRAKKKKKRRPRQSLAARKLIKGTGFSRVDGKRERVSRDSRVLTQRSRERGIRSQTSQVDAVSQSVPPPSPSPPRRMPSVAHPRAVSSTTHRTSEQPPG